MTYQLASHPECKDSIVPSIATAMTNLGVKTTPEQIYSKVKDCLRGTGVDANKVISTALRGTNLELRLVTTISEGITFDLSVAKAQILARVIYGKSVFHTKKIEFVTLTKAIKGSSGWKYAIVDHNYDPNKDYGPGFMSVPKKNCVIADVDAFNKDVEGGVLYYVIAEKDSQGGDFV